MQNRCQFWRIISVSGHQRWANASDLPFLSLTELSFSFFTVQFLSACLSALPWFFSLFQSHFSPQAKQTILSLPIMQDLHGGHLAQGRLFNSMLVVCIFA